MSAQVEYSVYFVPMPIGNRGDITLRSLEVLRSVDVIACEDTRHSSPLLTHWEIKKPLMSFHEHNEQHRVQEIITRIQGGETFAIISDAGMPGISDPGYRLLQSLCSEGIAYTVLPGPSSVLTALVGSALPSDAFFFGGFLPVKKGKRTQVLETALQASHTSVFLESPHRLPSTLEILSALDKEAPICVARELTKAFETFHRGTVAEIAEYFSERTVKGELVLLVGGKNARTSQKRSASEHE